MHVHACNLRPRPGRRVLGVEFVAPYLLSKFMKAGIAIIYATVLECSNRVESTADKERKVAGGDGGTEFGSPGLPLN